MPNKLIVLKIILINDRTFCCGCNNNHPLQKEQRQWYCIVSCRSGLIKTTEKLDYETTTQHNLTVEVTDGVYVSTIT